MKEDHLRWYTQHLSREFEMLTFGHAGYPVIAFPTSLGRYYQNKDFHLIDSVAHLVDSGQVMIYCPDGTQPAVTSALEAQGLRRMDYRFEEGGASVLLNAGLRLPPTTRGDEAGA